MRKGKVVITLSSQDSMVMYQAICINSTFFSRPGKLDCAFQDVVPSFPSTAALPKTPIRRPASAFAQSTFGLRVPRSHQIRWTKHLTISNESSFKAVCGESLGAAAKLPFESWAVRQSRTLLAQGTPYPGSHIFK